MWHIGSSVKASQTMRSPWEKELRKLHADLQSHKVSCHEPWPLSFLLSDCATCVRRIYMWLQGILGWRKGVVCTQCTSKLSWASSMCQLFSVAFVEQSLQFCCTLKYISPILYIYRLLVVRCVNCIIWIHYLIIILVICIHLISFFILSYIYMFVRIHYSFQPMRSKGTP